MTRYALLCAAAFGLFGPPAGGQPPAAPEAKPRLTLDDLDFLAGKWAGSLEYLDYADGRTRQRLEASLDARRAGGAIEYKFSYVEPNGKAVAGDPVKLTLQQDGTQLRLNDETWRVAGKTADARTGQREVVLVRAGTDGKKPAELKRTLTFANATLSIRTEVKPETAEKAFVRNEYVLKKR